MLKNNIRDYPDLLEYRTLMAYPLDGEKYIIICGNMRYFAMRELGYDEAYVYVLPKDTPMEKLNAYVIIDNNNFGEWDWDLLEEDWDMDDLESWGLNVEKDEDDEETKESEPSENYSRKIESPQYEPSGVTPLFSEMVDTIKYDALISEIKQTQMNAETKRFLTLAAARHIVFNYAKIADFYANADEKIQRLMEDSALVIIDFDDAISKGFVKLSKGLAEEYAAEEGS